MGFNFLLPNQIWFVRTRRLPLVPFLFSGALHINLCISPLSSSSLPLWGKLLSVLDSRCWCFSYSSSPFSFTSISFPSSSLSVQPLPFCNMATCIDPPTVCCVVYTIHHLPPLLSLPLALSLLFWQGLPLSYWSSLTILSWPCLWCSPPPDDCLPFPCHQYWPPAGGNRCYVRSFSTF